MNTTTPQFFYSWVGYVDVAGRFGEDVCLGRIEVFDSPFGRPIEEIPLVFVQDWSKFDFRDFIDDLASSDMLGKKELILAFNDKHPDSAFKLIG